MRRGPKPAKSKGAKSPIGRKSPKHDAARVRDLEKRLTEALKDKAEALEQQTAISEILRAISSSPMDLQPVLEGVVESATRFCGAHDAELYRLHGTDLKVVAHYGPISAPMGRLIPVVRGTVAGRAALERQAVHVADLQAEPEEFPVGYALAREFGYRTVVSVPLLREGEPIGTINLRRTNVNPFTDAQIALLQTFADQAVIAIENVRLFNETKEALEQQTATSEILRVIASSPTDVQPVVDAVAESAARLCEAFDAAIFRRDGDDLRLVAHHGPIPIQSTLPLVRGTSNGRAVLSGQTVHVADMQTEAAEFPEGSENARRMGHRTVLAVPLIREEGVAIGTINVRRTEAHLFTERQVALLQTFADQAVIAIENVRLFTELQASNRELTTALDTQTATSDILRVISRSQTDVQPVFDTIVQSAARLLRGYSGALARVAGNQIVLGALTTGDAANDAALRARFPRSLGAETPVGQAIRDRVSINVADAQGDARWPDGRISARIRGYRSLVAVPLIGHDEVVGAIAVTRRESGGFTDDEIALLQTFADQAVIAIENVRLFNETKEALEQQTATAEILRVISSSPTDIQPVLDAVVRSAIRLCEGYDAWIGLTEGGNLRVRAHEGPIAVAEELRPIRRGRVSETAVLERRTIHIHDLAASGAEFPQGHADALRIGQRTVLGVPLLREGEAIGVILIRRLEVHPFTDKQISLLQTFADQAVIAIENVRLFKELEVRNRDLTEALEQQTATSEILRVISSSPTDVHPVFDSLVASAARLCGANDLVLLIREADVLRPAAGVGSFWQSLPADFRVPLVRGTVAARSVIDGATLHLADLATLSEAEFPVGRDLQRRFGHHTVLAVPLVREGVALGTIFAMRFEVRPFMDQQVALLKTFADQAVIAIENVRLFKELEARNSALTESLEQQTATAEILQVISSSPTDLDPVLEAIARNAARLCEAADVAIARAEADGQTLLFSLGPDAWARGLLFMDRRTLTARAISEGRTIHAPDLLAEQDYDARARVERYGWRTALAVPLIREGVALGAITARRSEVRPFSDQQVKLLETFADQAVIAIENVRLFAELQARTAELTRSVEELTALGEVGRALSSTLNLEAVLQTIVTRANQLTGTAGCVIWEYDKPREEFRLLVSHYADDTDAAILPARGGVTTIPKGQGLTTQVMEERQAVQVPDITVAGAYESPVRKPLVDAGHRALLGVPLLSEDEVVGVLAVTRKTPGEFAPEIVRLLTTFATQSALAIQNARLFLEIEDKSRQLELASQHKSEFLANMSHELRTPLNAIIGFSEVLTERMFGDLNEKQAEYLKDIYASGTHLLSLINDILDLSKIEAGRMELELADFDLPTAIDNALMLVRERAGRRSITLQTAVDAGLGQVRADERKIRQVVLNLLSNAIKFTPEGGRIEVGAVSRDGFVEVSVSDTGVGIAREDQEAVFEEFRQVGTAEKKAEGTGLGLALCRRFVELHGGKVRVQSVVGRGSTFTFTIPVHRGE